jgi:transcriptional regulator with XRE-family HTH domain
VQEESVKNFTSRLERLQARLNCTDIDLAEHIGISRQLLYLMRAGTQQPSKKSIRLLQIAEGRLGDAPLGRSHDRPRKQGEIAKNPHAVENLPTLGNPRPPDFQSLERSQAALDTRLAALEADMKEILKLLKEKR